MYWNISWRNLQIFFLLFKLPSTAETSVCVKPSFGKPRNLMPQSAEDISLARFDVTWSHLRFLLMTSQRPKPRWPQMNRKSLLAFSLFFRPVSLFASGLGLFFSLNNIAGFEIKMKGKTNKVIFGFPIKALIPVEIKVKRWNLFFFLKISHDFPLSTSRCHKRRRQYPKFTLSVVLVTQTMRNITQREILVQINTFPDISDKINAKHWNSSAFWTCWCLYWTSFVLFSK